LTIGYPESRNDVKVRLPQSAILSTDHYQPLTKQLVDQYNQPSNSSSDSCLVPNSNLSKAAWQTWHNGTVYKSLALIPRPFPCFELFECAA